MAAQLERLRVRVVLKPFDLELLLDAVTEALAKNPATQEQTWRTSIVRDLEPTSGDGSQGH